MKLRTFVLTALSLLSVQAYAADATTPAKTALTTEKDKVSYSIGVDLGENFKRQGFDLDVTVLAQGMQDSLSSKAPLMTKQQMAETLIAFQKQVITKRQDELNALSVKNSADGKAFLAANKNKPGVITTASGLQYKVIDAGKGESPTDKDSVTVDYEGKLIDGKVFDSSYARKQPVTFNLSQVIPGWTEALKLMKPGATFEIVVPANLAYGERGIPNAIGPNQTLLFKVHLISVKKA